MTPELRNSQAVIDPVNTHAYVDLQFGPGGNRRPLWTMDDVYLANASRNAVHYMTVFWRRVPSMPAKEAAFDELLANLDLEALRALLDR